MTESGTIHRGSVMPAAQSQRLLVSGHGISRLGAVGKKGRIKGWPIYHLILEERATCPSYCPNWDNCIGNSQPTLRRHTHGPDLERILAEEVALLARDHPDGF